MSEVNREIRVRPLLPPPPSCSPQATATATRSSTGSSPQATGASTQCCTSHRSLSSEAGPKPSPCLARKAGEPETGREARRAHRRQLGNRVIRRMWRDEQIRSQPFALAA